MIGGCLSAPALRQQVVNALIEERVYEIAAAVCLEVGKNRMEALGEAAFFGALDRRLVAVRGGQQVPDLVEGQACPLPGLDHREGAHGVRAVDAPPAHPVIPSRIAGIPVPA